MTINPGEKVTFSYPSGNSVHNVTFNSAGPQPTIVRADGRRTRLLAGARAADRRVPWQTPGWVGDCTFTDRRHVRFFCSSHPDMIGHVVVAAASNAPPTVTAGRTPSGDVPRNTSVAFTATGTDADGDTLTYAWDFARRPDVRPAEPDHSYDAAGTYAAKVTVVRRQGRHRLGDADVIVDPAQPRPDGDRARTPTGNVATGTAVAFTATGTDPDGDTLTYSWDFGDGTPASTHAEPVAHLRRRRARTPPR